MKRWALFHPFLFTLTSVLFLYIPASATIGPLEIIRPAIWLIVLLILLIYPAYRITKNWDYTGIGLTIFVWGFYSDEIVFKIFFVGVVAVLVILGLSSKLLRKKAGIREVTLLLNILGIIFLLIPSIRLFSLLSLVPSSYYEENIFTQKKTPTTNLKGNNINPDIYYIVLDGYANADVLSDLYGFDNSNFVNYLEEKGFIIPSAAHSNYPKTALSIPSTLNMDYIQNFAPGLEQSHFWWLSSPYMYQSQAHLLLKENGYEIVSLITPWTISNNKSADVYYQPDEVQISEFENYIISKTAIKLLRPALKEIFFVPSLDYHRKIILFNFKTLSEISKDEQPQFIFVHLLSPHPPFIFDKDGNSVDARKSFGLDAEGFVDVARQAGLETENEIRAAYREGYIGQVQFLNEKVKQVVDDILENSKTPPIIIFQSDHGPGMLTDFRSLEETCLYERYSPLTAYYLPNIDPNKIPSNITPVNLFRIIFNEYFGADFPLLENKYYFSKDPMRIYDFDTISLERINKKCLP